MSRRTWRTACNSLVAAIALAGSTPIPIQAAVTSTYGDFSMMFSKSYGQYYAAGTNQIAGQWAWDPQSATESRIMWGMPWAPTNPPAYREQFILSGDWVVQPGWFDNGTFYQITTTTEWQAAPDCRTGRVFLPTGGPEHYTHWAIPAASYCLYAEGYITEQLTGVKIRFVHQQVWSPPTQCPVNAAPNAIRRPGDVFFAPSDCLSHWESWSDDRGRTAGDLAVKLERAGLMARGIGVAYQIRQLYPSVWSGDERYAGSWG